ncbi:glutathione S-transferase family protein [Variovorax sp. OV329]|uniref:glutathione S-transferase family protein n=1 Tax=Variovorax sp. OV329 TaxID=1882825 RepID=UPI0008E9B95A|nr:glutathione S-transferase [Variovorax sp. OV329]
MKLYYMAGASSLAPHIVLEWTGQAYEAIRADRQSIRSPKFLSLNPSGVVPALVHDDFTLTENVAILGYLSDLHPLAQLSGDGSLRTRAEVMRWLGFLNSDVHKAFRPIFYPERFLPSEDLASELGAAARGQVREYLKRLDAQLQGRDWLTGQRSIADPYLFVMLRWAVGTKVGLHGFDNLRRFISRMHADPGVHAALMIEESLAPRSTAPPGVPDQLRRLDARVREDRPTTLEGEVIGTVEYSEGDGAPREVRRGLVEIEVSRMDTVFSWSDENYRGQAAIPFQNFTRYVSDGAIRLDY